jgi:uncharacterized membrane protein
MLLTFVSILIMFAVAYAFLREGILTACVMCINILLAGLVAFNFWEPLARLADPPLNGTFMGGYEDALCLLILFCVTLALLRVATNALSPSMVVFPPAVQRGGGFAFGLLAGYFVAGFLLCTFQTLPWHENFMFFEPGIDREKDNALRRFLPPDRVWLSLMYQAGRYSFANNLDERGSGKRGSDSPLDQYQTFDKYGTFELRYSKYRRYSAKTRWEPQPYKGEFDSQMPRNR